MRLSTGLCGGKRADQTNPLKSSAQPRGGFHPVPRRNDSPATGDLACRDAGGSHLPGANGARRERQWSSKRVMRLAPFAGLRAAAGLVHATRPPTCLLRTGYGSLLDFGSDTALERQSWRPRRDAGSLRDLPCGTGTPDDLYSRGCLLLIERGPQRFLSPLSWWLGRVLRSYPFQPPSNA